MKEVWLHKILSDRKGEKIGRTNILENKRTPDGGYQGQVSQYAD